MSLPERENDIQAYQLLKKLGIPVTPELFVGQIPQNDKMPGYREELEDKLGKV